MNEYALIDSGNGRKLEKFGKYLFDRPCSQAHWSPSLSNLEWEKAHSQFLREEDGQWTACIQDQWQMQMEGVRMNLMCTDFGHLGVFPEHALLWKFLRKNLKPKMRFLNLFAYSGIASIIGAQEKAEVCHLDASKPMIQWAKENAALNNMEKNIRWIVDDVFAFLKREKRRDNRYDAILLDPPSFGRGLRGQVFKLERDIRKLLSFCADLLSEKTRFVIFSCHTPGFTPTTLSHLLKEALPKGTIEKNELLLPSAKSLSLPCGNYAIWKAQ